MSAITFGDGTVLRSEVDMIDATMMHRPAVGWKHVDAAGHVHEWHVVKADGSRESATSYSPLQSYDVPSLAWVKDGEWYDEDGEPHPVGHNECRQCAERIEPAYTADTCQQMVPGLRRYYINDEPVSREAFTQAYERLSKR